MSLHQQSEAVETTVLNTVIPFQNYLPHVLVLPFALPRSLLFLRGSLKRCFHPFRVLFYLFFPSSSSFSFSSFWARSRLDGLPVPRLLLLLAVLQKRLGYDMGSREVNMLNDYCMYVVPIFHA